MLYEEGRKIGGKDFAQYVLIMIFTAALGHAAVMDGRYQRVRRGIWLWAGAAAVLLFAIRMKEREEELCSAFLEIVVFISLQFLFFSKMYGRADCFAFSCSGIFLGAFGGGIRECLLHMLLSIGILGAVQLCRGNVNRHGNLREPKAFIPYIFVALLLIALWLIPHTAGSYAGQRACLEESVLEILKNLLPCRITRNNVY